MPRALLVDDSADIRLLMATMLRAGGFDVDEAADGVDALAALDRPPPPDVVVLDVQMPTLDGWATLAAIRGGGETAGLPVVLCTVRASAADRAKAWELGCDGYVVKPFDIDVVVSEVRAALDRAASDRSAFRRQQLLGLAAEARERGAGWTSPR